MAKKGAPRLPNPERAALLTGICESPDDDTVRLVFADWLDEHGDPDRAEFIRLQIAHAAAPVTPDEAKARVEELLARNQAVWWGELPIRPGITWLPTPHPFDRGFAWSVWFRHGKSWREHAAEVFAAAPVSRLQCGGTFTERTARPVFASPFLGRVADLSGLPLDTNGAESLANNPHLVGRLRTLQVANASDGDAAAAVLGGVPGLRNLETLTFGKVGPAGVAALAASPHLTRLKDLRLHGSPVGDEGAEALAASPHLSSIEHILLNYCGIGDRGATALSRSERLTSLRQLYLGGGNPITDAGAREIASSTGLPRLTELHLWECLIGDEGATLLADFAERRGLQLLNLRSCPISAAVTRGIKGRLGDRFYP